MKETTDLAFAPVLALATVGAGPRAPLGDVRGRRTGRGQAVGRRGVLGGGHIGPGAVAVGEAGGAAALSVGLVVVGGCRCRGRERHHRHGGR